MDHIRILRRAFDITRFYRARWVFGILVALTTARGGGDGGGGGGGGTGTRTPLPNQFPPFGLPAIPAQVINMLIGIGISLICVLILLAVAFAILHYISQTALIRMVDGYEATNERVRVGQGFRLGWSRGAFRIWLVDLLFFVIGFAAVILLLLVAAAPLLLWLTRNNTVGVIGTILTVSMAIAFILALIIVGAFVSLWLQVARRAIILEGRGVFEGLREAWNLARRHLGDVIVMGLILFGLGLAFAILTIPLVFILIIVGGLAGGLPALLAGGITNLLAHGVVPWIVGALVGAPIFLAVLIVPLAFLGGLVETFYSSVWTLTYRELLALDAVRAETPPQQPGPEAAA